MKAKRITVWLMTLLLVLGATASGFAQSGEPEGMETSPLARTDAMEQEQEEELGIQWGTQVVVGSTTTMSGRFGLGGWSDNAADEDVRELLHGYETVSWARLLGLAVNQSVVESSEEIEEEDGSWTFVFHLKDGLAYNDGTAITAQDYVFSLLLLTSPEIRSLGGSYSGMEHLVGYEEYAVGESSILEGVHLLGRNDFSMRIKKESLPHYYGIGMLLVDPRPIHVIAPGCEVRDDGEGAYLAPADGADQLEADAYTPGEFSAEMLAETLLNPETGYEFFPRVTSGPYQLESFDAQAGVATFKVNEYFVGNYEGQRPHIETIVVKHVSKDSMVEELESGSVNLLARVSDKDVISEVQDLSGETGKYLATSYPRTGLAFLAFACEEGPTASESVRNAIARSFSKEQLVQQTAGNYAAPAYGYYGYGQWMTEFVSEGTEYYGPIDIPAELEEIKVTRNLGEAKKLLTGDGWTLNEQGEAFDEEVDSMRYRKGAEGELEPLMIRWAVSQESSVGLAMVEPLAGAFAELGIGLEVTELPFNEMLDHYYRLVPRTYNMFFMATNFNYLFDPYYDFSANEEYQGVINKTGLSDQRLTRLAEEMRNTSPEDDDLYARRWLAFQQRFTELMPVVPLYSNTYFDFYTNTIRDYHINTRSGWGLGILYVWIDDTPTVG